MFDKTQNIMKQLQMIIKILNILNFNRNIL
jgi:hypothetical protein